MKGAISNIEMMIARSTCSKSDCFFAGVGGSISVMPGSWFYGRTSRFSLAGRSRSRENLTEHGAEIIDGELRAEEWVLTHAEYANCRWTAEML